MATLVSEDGRYQMHHDPESSEYVTIVERSGSTPSVNVASVNVPRRFLMELLGLKPSEPASH